MSLNFGNATVRNHFEPRPEAPRYYDGFFFLSGRWTAGCFSVVHVKITPQKFFLNPS